MGAIEVACPSGIAVSARAAASSILGSIRAMVDSISAVQACSEGPRSYTYDGDSRKGQPCRLLPDGPSGGSSGDPAAPLSKRRGVGPSELTDMPGSGNRVGFPPL